MARRKKSDLPPATAQDVSELLSCPEGHTLPCKTPQGECTPVYCADSSYRKGKSDVPAIANSAADFELAAPADAESGRIALAQRRLQARLKALNVPEFADTEAAEQWADREMLMLLPLAVADVKADLQWGDDTQREKARRQVLDATGRGKRDGNANVGGPVIMIVGNADGGGIQLPWAQRVASISTTDVKQLPKGEKK